MILIDAIPNGRTQIGRLGENDHRGIRFPSAATLAMYPDATVTVLHQRPGDPAAYPVDPANVTVNDGYVIWEIKNADLSAVGTGIAEVVYTQGSIVAKTEYYNTQILPALDNSATPPEPWESWIAALTEAANHAPQIISGKWWAWNSSQEAYVNTGVNATGDKGDPGDDGHSPVITTSKSGKTTTIMSDGQSIGTVLDGEDGQDGSDYQITPSDYQAIAGIVAEDASFQQFVTDAQNAAEDAIEAATGKDKNGNPVPSTNPHYENNAYYHSQQAGLSAQAAEQSKNAAQAASASELMHRITSLNGTPLSSLTVEAVGIPVYVDDVTQYSAYGLTDTGWYIFARITAKGDVKVTAQTSITGDAGHIATVGADHVDLAIRFEVAAVSKSVTITWGGETETFIFKATDLAVRNLDYRTTFYIYDIAPYTTWTYGLTSDETFQAGKSYYTESGGEYTKAIVTTGEAVPANTYYVHTKVTFSGMVRNVTYRLNETIDCPIEIVLPVVPDDGYGAWFEIQMHYNASYSTTLLPTDANVVIGTANTQGQTAGINVIDLQYSEINGIKMWTLLNTHSNLPAAS